MRIWDLIKTAVAAGAMLGISACTVHQADEGPAPFGPSEFATGVTLAVTPDTINFDGSSQASIVVTARDANGLGKSGVVVLLSALSGGASAGTLSARTIVTGTDGRATAVFTAPAPTLAQNGTVQLVTISATPTGSDFSGSVSRTAEIRLVPSGVILPPADTPTAQFTFPTPAAAGSSITFDASTSCAGALTAGSCDPTTSSISAYVWTFGDGGTGSGSVVNHTYSIPGSYSVTLTVTNSRGLKSSTTKSVTVSTAQTPSGDWVISPTAPNVNETVFFNADGVRPAAGHTISSYIWDFGDGTTGTNAHTSHVYTAARTYAVVLSVRDDTGATTVLSKNITIGTGNPNAVLTVTKTGDVGGLEIRADGGSSSAAAGSTISTYSFDLPGCTPSGQVGSQSSVTTVCTAGSHTLRLTVTDDLGRSSSTTSSVTVP